MTLAQALEFVEPFRMVEPGPTALECMAGFHRRRQASLSSLEVRHGLCCWCNVQAVAPKRRRYCSSDCIESGARYCNPQSPATKAWLLIHRQGCACSWCGLDYSAEVIARIRRAHDLIREHAAQWPKFFPDGPTPVTYHAAGSNTGDLWEVDHVVPIHKGGRGIGLDNVQVICVECHRKKTIADRSAA